MKRGTKAIIGSIVISAVNVSSYATLSNYVEPLRAAFGLDFKQVSLIFTFHAVASLVLSLFFGKIVKKVSVRLIVAAGALMFSAFFLSIYFAETMTAVYAGVALMGAAFVFSGLVMSQTLVVWWAEKNVGRAMSYVAIGFSVTSFLVSPLIAKGIIALGLRTTALIHGAIGCAILLLADIFLIPEHPDKYGEAAVRKDADAPAVRPGAVFRTYPFWCVAASVFLFNMAFNGFNNNASVFYQSIGAGAVEASYGISIYGIISVAWSYFHGALTDKKGPGAANAVCALAGAGVLFAAAFLKGFAGVVVISLVLGSMSVGGTIGAVTFPYVYGKRDGGALIGYGNVATSLGSMLGAPLAASFFDATGSYNGYLFVASAATAASLVLLLLASNKKALANARNAAVTEAKDSSSPRSSE